MDRSDALLRTLARVEQRHAWQSLIVDGHEWRWLDTAADGPVAVLLPGSVGDAGMFAPVLDQLGAEARLIAVTYPALVDAPSLADGLAAVLDHLAVASTTVVGSSFAAWWAQSFALRHSRRVQALVIGNGFVEGADLSDNPLFNRETVESTPAAQLHQTWLDRVRAQPETPLQQLQAHMLATRQSPENLRARFLGVVRARPSPPLPIPPAAVTVLDCDDDPLIPAPIRARVHAQHPGARRISMPHGGHYPHLLSTPAYLQLLKETLVPAPN